MKATRHLTSIIVALVLAGTVLSLSIGEANSHAIRQVPNRPTPTSAAKAYRFLDGMMDRYVTGSRLRLVQSYTGGVLGKRGFTDSFPYDDALIIDAFLARGRSGDIRRARVLASSLIYIQAHDPDHDGRFRAAYAPTPLTSPSKIRATDMTTDVGELAWVGDALVQLYARTRSAMYLRGAQSMALWVQKHARDSRGQGGYTGGQHPNGSPIRWKSTEHNLDIYSFFDLLAKETGDRTWAKRALWARRFVRSMWDASARDFLRRDWQ